MTLKYYARFRDLYVIEKQLNYNIDQYNHQIFELIDTLAGNASL